MRRRLLPLLVIGLTCAACGGGGSSSSSKEPSAADRAGQTLSIYGFGTGDDVAINRAAVAKQAIAPAKIRNPDGAFNPQQFLTRLASGDVPDVIYVDRQQIATLAAKGALQPIDSCVTDQNVDTSQYRRAALDEVTYKGELYALPEFSNQRTLIVNDDAVQEAGLQVSDVSTTNWDKLRTVAKKLTKVQGGKVTRIGFDPKIPEFFILWAKANGADLMSDDGLKPNFTDPKVVEALEYTKSLIDEQGGWSRFKAFRDTWDFFGANNQVAADQVGAWPMESWYWNVMAESSPDVNVTAVPFTDRDGNPITFMTGSGWAIPAGAEHAALACTWMKAMTGVKAWLNAARKRAASSQKDGHPFTGLYTANTTADERILNEVYEPVSPQFDKAVRLLVDVQDDAVTFPASPAGTQVQQALTDAINRVLAGTQSPQAALARAQTEAQKAIDDATSSS